MLVCYSLFYLGRLVGLVNVGEVLVCLGNCLGVCDWRCVWLFVLVVV